jgi:hypothetical protein
MYTGAICPCHPEFFKITHSLDDAPSPDLVWYEAAFSRFSNRVLPLARTP